MNKFGIVLGAAAVVTFAGCKDPDYKYANAAPSQSEVKSVATADAPAPVKSVESAPEPVIVSTPAPAPAPAAPSATAPVVAEPAFTEYVVQEGDYLSKISKRYNVTLSSIHRLNPSIKRDVIRVGQKIKLPGKIDLGAQTEPVKATAKATARTTAKRSGASADYTGATKEYVVKNGDTLGSVAYGNGITIRQLKKLNGLTSDSLKIGQKLKIPAEKVVKAPAAKVNKPDAPAAVAEKKVEAAAAPVVPAVDAPVVEEKKEAAESDAAAPAAASAAPAAAPATATYVVQEGDDMTGVSIRWGVSAAEIRELNNLAENDQLVPGQIIKLPAEAQQ